MYVFEGFIYFYFWYLQASVQSPYRAEAPPPSGSLMGPYYIKGLSASEGRERTKVLMLPVHSAAVLPPDSQFSELLSLEKLALM